MVNELQFRSRTIQPLVLGEDRGWGSNLRLALQRLEHSHVLYMQEDYFLNAPVRGGQLASDLAYAFEHDTDAFCLRARTVLEQDFQPINDRFGVVPRDSDGRTRNQVGLWKRGSLLAVLRDGESGWEVEAHASERTRDMRVLSYSTRENASVSYLMSAIVRGLWTRDALAMCAAHNFKIDPHFRGTYSDRSAVSGLRRALTRRRLKSELARARNSVIDLDAIP